jgi:ketosteroid isomerase-like protein
MNSRFRRCLSFLAVIALFVHSVSADEAEVHEAIKKYVAAFNSQDVATIKSMWAANATHVDHQLGERTDGRDEIVADIAAVFKANAQLLLSGNVNHVRLIKEGVASIDGEVIISDGQSEPAANQFNAILLKEGSQWVIDSMEERALARTSSAQAALAELNWLVGTWQDASEGAAVETTVRWSIGGAFLVRNFDVKMGDENASQGTQIIGFDPRSQQIRSWSFNADGSFGDGVWSKSGNQWLIKSTQTLTDGRAASGVYVVTPKDQDQFTVQLIGREVEGELQPSTEEVVVKRSAQATAAEVPATNNQR